MNRFMTTSGAKALLVDGFSLLKLTQFHLRWLKIIFAFLVGGMAMRIANGILSGLALNNFTRDAYDWRRELVVVTGGSGGLGDLLVRKLAKRGIKVISLDIVPPKSPLPANAYFYETEITTTGSLKKVTDRIREEHGDPTVLVNNAGVTNLSCILDQTEDDIRRVFNVNIISNFLLIKEFLPAMIKHNHGHIITIASMASFITGVRNVDYACTKASALALHEGLAQELRHHYKARKVRTSIVHPTYIRTPLIDKVHNAGGFRSTLLEPDAVVDRIFSHILSGKSGQIFLPGPFSIAAGIRGWPMWLQEIARNSQKQVLAHT